MHSNILFVWYMCMPSININTVCLHNSLWDNAQDKTIAWTQFVLSEIIGLLLYFAKVLALLHPAVRIMSVNGAPLIHANDAEADIVLWCLKVSVMPAVDITSFIHRDKVCLYTFVRFDRINQ